MDKIDADDVYMLAKANVSKFLEEFALSWRERTDLREAAVAYAVLPDEVKRFLQPEVRQAAEELVKDGGM